MIPQEDVQCAQELSNRGNDRDWVKAHSLVEKGQPSGLLNDLS